MKETKKDQKELGNSSPAESIPDLMQMKRKREEKCSNLDLKIAFKAFSHLVTLNHLHSVLDLHKLVSLLGIKMLSSLLFGK